MVNSYFDNSQAGKNLSEVTAPPSTSIKSEQISITEVWRL